MDVINNITEKHTGPEAIDDSVFEHYSVDKADIQNIYNNYRLYNRILQYARKSKIDKEEARRKSKMTYYCELCDKDVRLAVKYHHVRTMKHIKLQNAVEKHMEEMRNNEETS
jgi:hypothetical protein